MLPSRICRTTSPIRASTALKRRRSRPRMQAFEAVIQHVEGDGGRLALLPVSGRPTPSGTRFKALLTHQALFPVQIPGPFQSGRATHAGALGGRWQRSWCETSHPVPRRWGCAGYAPSQPGIEAAPRAPSTVQGLQGPRAALISRSIWDHPANVSSYLSRTNFCTRLPVSTSPV